MLVEVVRTVYADSESGFTILMLRDMEGKRGVIKGVCRIPFPLREGEVLFVDGEWRVHRKYGEQLDISRIELPERASPETIKRILCFGPVKGIGPVLAERIISKFGESTIKILDTCPERLLEVEGIGRKNLKVIIDSWRSGRKTITILSELCSLGLTVNIAGKAYDRWGEEAPEVVRKNPYSLTDIHGIGFKKADEIAAKLGFAKDNPERVKSGILYILQQASQKGHCYLPYGELVRRASDLDIGEDRIKPCLEELRVRKKVVVSDVDRVYPFSLYEAEKRVAENLKRLSMSPSFTPVFPRTSSCSHLTDEQHRALRNALSHSVSIITGLPGTGKTTTLKAVADVLSESGETVYLCAPTGKAAKRLSEVTGRPARTIHRLLRFEPVEIMKNGRIVRVAWRFGRDEINPLEPGCVIVDEHSMVDILLMDALLRAMPSGSRLLVVGDYNQLPPVGPGDVLRDLIRSRVFPVTELRRIHRQAERSGIVKLAHMIHEGLAPVWRSADDVYFVEEERPEEIQKIILRAARYFADRLGAENVQVLSPMRKGPLGVEELNRMLQDELNPPAGGRSLIFREGDRVMQIVNNYTRGVFNGEVGYVERSDPEEGVVVVRFDEREVLYTRYELDELTLSYAMTIHKSQGSEFDCVIIPVHMQHFVMLKRQLIYTAVTRARKYLVLVGMPRAFRIAVSRNEEAGRYTGLFR